MNVLIVYAHPEPRSFNGAMRDLAVQVLTEQGHQVQVSDLYAMNFKAGLDQADFPERSNPDHFKPQAEQMQAVARGALTPDVQAEIEKVKWADVIIFQFPLWWFSIPALLKGWVDRVFAMGFAYGPGQVYTTGPLKGKRAMLAFTTGGPAAAYAPSGRNGDLNMLLYHVHHGMLYFSGMDVLPPFTAYSPVRIEPEARAKYLEEFRQRLLTLDTTAPLTWE